MTWNEEVKVLEEGYLTGFSDQLLTCEPRYPGFQSPKFIMGASTGVMFQGTHFGGSIKQQMYGNFGEFPLFSDVKGTKSGAHCGHLLL